MGYPVQNLGPNSGFIDQLGGGAGNFEPNIGFMLSTNYYIAEFVFRNGSLPLGYGGSTGGDIPLPLYLVGRVGKHYTVTAIEGLVGPPRLGVSRVAARSQRAKFSPRTAAKAFAPAQADEPVVEGK